MSWAIGWDSNWNRDVGYGVPCECDHPKCKAKIHRGLSYVCCDQEPYGGDGCGLYFCGDHHDYRGRCPKCARYDHTPYKPKPDLPKWMRWKLKDPSWKQWRDENPKEVKAMKKALKS